MKLKNEKTNPFSPCLSLVETNRSPTRTLTFAVKTAQKIHNITGEMTNLGTLKNEETNPTFHTRSCPKHKIPQSFATVTSSPMMRPKFLIIRDTILDPAPVVPHGPAPVTGSRSASRRGKCS